AADLSSVVGRLVKAGARDRLGGRDQRQLGEAVGAAHLAPGQMVRRLEVRAAAEAVLDPRLAGRPAVVQSRRADAKRRDRADSGDRNAAHQDWREDTKSTTSWTVVIFSISASLISIVYSSSITWASSTRSSESMSRSSK